MIRFQIYLTKTQKLTLGRLNRSKATPVSELVRRAIDEFIFRETQNSITINLEKFSGIWKDREDLPDFNAIRTSLDRS